MCFRVQLTGTRHSLLEMNLNWIVRVRSNRRLTVLLPIHYATYRLGFFFFFCSFVEDRDN